MFYYPSRILKELLLDNSRDQEIIQNMSPGDSSLRTGSVCLAFVTGENAYCCNSCTREIVKNISPVDSSLRTGSVCLAFVTGENA